MNAAPRGRHALLGGAPQKRDDGQALRRRVHQGAPPAAPPKNLCAALRVGTASPIARLSWRNNGPGASDSARPSDEHPSPGLTAAALGRADAARTARLRHQCHRRTARRLPRVRHPRPPPPAAAASLPKAGSARGAPANTRCARRGVHGAVHLQGEDCFVWKVRFLCVPIVRDFTFARRPPSPRGRHQPHRAPRLVSFPRVSYTNKVDADSVSIAHVDGGLEQGTQVAPPTRPRAPHTTRDRCW